MLYGCCVVLLNIDLGLGHYAFVYFINKEWDPKNGGTLKFQCKRSKTTCFEVEPEFNKLILFKVYPEYVPHNVVKVIVNEPRMAATGWFYADRDGIDWRGLNMQIGYGKK